MIETNFAVKDEKKVSHSQGGILLNLGAIIYWDPKLPLLGSNIGAWSEIKLKNLAIKACLHGILSSKGRPNVAKHKL